MLSSSTAFTHCPDSGTGSGSRKPKLSQSLLLFLHLWEVYRGLRLQSRSAVGKMKKSKGLRVVWKTSRLFTSTSFSFFHFLCCSKSTVAWKHLRLERLGQSWKDIHWTRFWHQIKVFLPQAILAWSGLISCVGFKLMQPILSQRTFWLPASKNGADWVFHHPWFFFIRIFTHSCLVKIWDFCGPFVFCLCDWHIKKKKKKPEMSVISRGDKSDCLRLL